MIESLLPAASTYASDIDNLFTLIFVLVGFWFFLCQGVFFWLLFRFLGVPEYRALAVVSTLRAAPVNP